MNSMALPPPAMYNKELETYTLAFEISGFCNRIVVFSSSLQKLPVLVVHSVSFVEVLVDVYSVQ